MTTAIDLIRSMGHAAMHVWAQPINSGRFAAVGLVLILWCVMRLRQRDLWKRLFSRSFLTDATYYAFYGSGIYAIAVAFPLFVVATRFIHRFAPFLELNLTLHAPAVVQIAASSIAVDLSAYWWHRAVHASPFLWRFHRIHHSQTQLSPLTTYRMHVADMALRALIAVIPSVILGLSSAYFVVMVWIETVFGTLAHSDLSWTYGVFGKVMVSPQFHRIHHATDEELRDRNFGILYGVWDWLFGTATGSVQKPAAYGVSEPVPEGFILQLADPVLSMLRSPQAAVAPAEVPPTADRAVS